jgi:phage shock protein PspC (stress-responsive transcriptional regulator)
LPLPKEGFGKLKGIVLGGFFGGFLVVLYLIASLFLKDLLK